MCPENDLRHASGEDCNRRPRCLDRFTRSESGAATVDFLPLVFAVIGLCVAVFSYLSTALESPSMDVAATLKDFEIETELPVVQATIPSGASGGTPGSSAPGGEAGPGGTATSTPTVPTPPTGGGIESVSVTVGGIAGSGGGTSGTGGNGGGSDPVSAGDDGKLFGADADQNGQADAASETGALPNGET